MGRNLSNRSCTSTRSRATAEKAPLRCPEKAAQTLYVKDASFCERLHELFESRAVRKEGKEVCILGAKLEIQIGAIEDDSSRLWNLPQTNDGHKRRPVEFVVLVL
jgi:hypothetical protein